MSLSEDEFELLSAARPPYTPPRFTIDLSLEPKNRYRLLAQHYRDDVQNLTGLFDNLLLDAGVPNICVTTVHRVARLLLRKVYVTEQTEELRGISDVTGIPMYLLVAFNVILDLLMGCTSGAVLCGPRSATTRNRMLHFRTLDWTMEKLRNVIVQLDFILSRSAHPDKILASSITYVGFTGVLTGVRPGLSMSLNFRAVHDVHDRVGNFRFYLHHLLVLFGWRPSIATILRDVLIGDHECAEQESQTSSREDTRTDQPLDLASICDRIDAHHTTAAYLIFSDGHRTISIDKDYRTSRVRSSETFIATTNHDEADPDSQQEETEVTSIATVQTTPRHVSGLEELLDESKDRLQCVTQRWDKLVSRRRNQLARQGTQWTTEEVAQRTFLQKRQLIEWISKWPTTNECTHFAAVMDPVQGSVLWATAYPQPVVET